MSDDPTRREFLEMAGRGAAGLVVLSVVPGCEAFDISAEGEETPWQFLTPDADWFWHSALEYDEKFAPELPASEWKLDIRSGGKNVGEVTFRKLKALESDGFAVSYLKTLRCIKGSFAGTAADTKTATGIFRGIPLAKVLDETSISGETSKLRFTAHDGFETSIPYDRVVDEEKLPVILAFELNGRPLTPARGGPVRLVVPEMWAYKCMKWVVSVDATTDFSSWGTFETSGDFGGKPELDNPGLMALSTLAHNPGALKANVSGPGVQLRGMALVGGHRIASVEVVVDGGEAQQATIPDLETLLDGLGHDALFFQSAEQFGENWPYPNIWTPWRLNLDLSPGQHQIIIRSVDDEGRANPSISEDPQLAKEVVIDLEVT
jgi:DMSO/TMAO reductase YedYZ molybdopterin-dependent catalytic subunit